jgi:hypothetical protein
MSEARVLLGLGLLEQPVPAVKRTMGTRRRKRRRLMDEFEMS